MIHEGATLPETHRDLTSNGGWENTKQLMGALTLMDYQRLVSEIMRGNKLAAVMFANALSFSAERVANNLGTSPETADLPTLEIALGNALRAVSMIAEAYNIPLERIARQSIEAMKE